MHESGRRRWLQFRLRTLLIAILVLSLPLSWLAVKIRSGRRQREAAGAVLRVGGAVSYNCGIVCRFRVPSWLDELLGTDFSVVNGVCLDHHKTHGRPVGDNDLALLSPLTNLKYLDLTNSRITDTGLENLKGHTRLEQLYVHGTQVTNEGVKSLQVALPDCAIQDSRVSPYAEPPEDHK